MTLLLRSAARLLFLLALAAPAAAQEPPPGTAPLQLQLLPAGGASPRVTLAWEREGVVYVDLNDLSILLQATKFWRPELARMTLVVSGHEVAVTDGSGIAVVDDVPVHLPGPVFRWEGRFLVPVQAVVDDAGEARPWVEPLPVSFSRSRRVLSATHREGTIEGALLLPMPTGWKLSFRADTEFKDRVIRAERSGFVLLLRGLRYDPLLYPLPPEHDWFQGLRLRNLPEGVEVSFSAGPAVQGYRIDRPAPDALDVVLGFDEREVRAGTLERFSTVRGLVPSRIHLVALDPGHGGVDPGCTWPEAAEDDLALSVCRRISTVLRLDLDVEGLVLRETHEGLSASERAVRANHAEADLLISVHVHDRPGGPVAFVAVPPEEGADVPRDVAALGFRAFGRGQSPYLNASRLLARSLVDAVAGRLHEDPAGVFEERLLQLQGAAMPAVMIEIGAAGEAPDDETLEAVAEGVVEGIRIFLVSGGE